MTTTTTSPELVMAPAEARTARWRRFSFGRLFTHVVLLLIVLLWTLPTAGLLISSLRDPDQLARNGWWTALSSTEIQDFARLPTADQQVFENGQYVIRGNLLGEDTNRSIQTFGGTANGARDNLAGAPAKRLTTSLGFSVSVSQIARSISAGE